MGARTRIGRKSIAVWGPVVLNQVLKDKVFEDCKPDIDRPPRACKGKKAEQRRPVDPDWLQQEAFHAELEHRYQHHHEDEISPDGRVTIWTDGSEKTIQGQQVSGAGVFYGINNSNNMLLRVQGDNDRAELAAFLHCLETEPRDMDVRTDSRYVADGVREWRNRWRARAWFRRPLQAQEITNADMWKRVDKLLQARNPGAVQCNWVRGHAHLRHVNAGETSDLHVWQSG